MRKIILACIIILSAMSSINAQEVKDKALMIVGDTIIEWDFVKNEIISKSFFQNVAFGRVVEINEDERLHLDLFDELETNKDDEKRDIVVIHRDGYVEVETIETSNNFFVIEGSLVERIMLSNILH